MQLTIQNIRLRNLLIFGLLKLSVVAAYFKVLTNGFVFDDETLIVNNRYLRHIEDWWLFFVSPHSAGAGIASPFYRPLPSLIYLLLYQINGPAPILYHAFNIALHALNTSLVYVLGRRLGFDPYAVFFAALLWGLHPVHVEAVAYASASADVLYAFFILWGTIVLLPDFSPRRICLSLPLFILALLSKEAAIVFPLLAMVLQYLVLQRDFSLKSTSRLWPLWLVTGIYAAAHMAVSTFAGFSLYNAPNACADALSCRIFTYFATLPSYFMLLIWPFHLHPERSFPSFSDPWHVSVVAGMVIVGLIFLLACTKLKIPQKRIMAAGGLWFLAAGLMTSGLLMPVNGVFMEHWLYLPTVGLFLCFSEALRNVLPHKTRLALLILAVILGIFWSIRTVEQNRTWLSPETFYANILKNSDHLPRVYVAIGFLDMRLGDKAHALEQFQKAIEKSNDSIAEAQYGYGDALYSMAKSNADIEASIQHFQRALALKPDLFVADKALAVAYTELGQTEKALYYQEQARRVMEKLRSKFLQ